MSLYNLVRSECVLSFDRIFAYFFIHSLVACSAREHTKKKHIFRVVACRIGNAWCLFFIVVVYFLYNMSPIGWCVPVCGPRGRYRSVFIPHCFLLPLLLRHSGYASPLFLHWRLRGFACLHQPFRCQPLIFLFFFILVLVICSFYCAFDFLSADAFFSIVHSFTAVTLLGICNLLFFYEQFVCWCELHRNLPRIMNENYLCCDGVPFRVPWCRTYRHPAMKNGGKKWNWSETVFEWKICGDWERKIL